MNTQFSPELKVRVVAPALAFYQKAFGVEEVRRFSNDDGSIHIVELRLQGAGFYVHEQMPGGAGVSPEELGGTSVELALFVADPDKLVNNALAEGAKLVSPLTDHFYGLRQGTVLDPFGHLWTFQKEIAERKRDE